MVGEDNGQLVILNPSYEIISWLWTTKTTRLLNLKIFLTFL
jgi:hypothetical protein